MITSTSNPRISRLRSLQTGKGRKDTGLFFMEGPHLLAALLDARLYPQEVYYEPERVQRTEEGAHLLQRLQQLWRGDEGQLVEVSERVMTSLSDTQTSQGVISVLPLDAFTAERARSRRPRRERSALLILDEIADPGNMGTILRTALAADVEAVLLTQHSVDCFSPKVVRSAAGAHIALPIERELGWQEIAARVSAHHAQHVLLAEANSPHLYYEEQLTQPFALIIGNEAHGPSQHARAMATREVSIPLYNQVESLNAAMATGIILYEAVRQVRVRLH